MTAAVRLAEWDGKETLLDLFNRADQLMYSDKKTTPISNPSGDGFRRSAPGNRCTKSRQERPDYASSLNPTPCCADWLARTCGMVCGQDRRHTPLSDGLDSRYTWRSATNVMAVDCSNGPVTLALLPFRRNLLQSLWIVLCRYR